MFKIRDVNEKVNKIKSFYDAYNLLCTYIGENVHEMHLDLQQVRRRFKLNKTKRPKSAFDMNLFVYHINIGLF